MTLLADQIDGVIGVDTHRDTLTVAAVTPVGGLLGQLAVHADGAGYQRLLDFARAQVAGRRCFAVEGAGSYGAGLARMPAERGKWVVEVDRPSRPARRGGKTDALVRLRDDPETRAYARRRQAEGKSPREIRRCVKRAVARQLFKLLERCDQVGVQLVSVS
jgi:transposase